MDLERDHDAASLVTRTIAEVAPDLAPDELRAEDDLRDELELDSMDLRSLAAALASRAGIDPAEAEWARVRTVGDLVDLVAAGQRA